jgi:Uncharacterized protein conserved in bacteria (DUF2087)
MGTNVLTNELAALVVKRGVSVGGLTHAQRLLALAVPALALAPGAQATEGEVNAILKRALDGPASFMACDHVELRRWLVDTRWWQRDGYGKCYGRVADDCLSDEQRAITRALDGIDLPAWVESARGALRRDRDARRAEWSAGRRGSAHG